eukprot:CAMPEP_0172740090 /NCGR_PEP_ID=MMETSP1074-20121228/124093_1 /TAXON_ID=2916 /ORGANISM="Ceratium fusus, Strain PA161109" /LENGTH=185 /DNA_ID=CAMNT_0013570123 /DNA_START=77 /DNA_END=634 /DNA_ORIENTATION=-
MAQVYNTQRFHGKSHASVRAQSPVPRVDCSVPQATRATRADSAQMWHLQAARGRESHNWTDRDAVQTDSAANELRRQAALRRSRKSKCGQCNIFGMCGMDEGLHEPEEDYVPRAGPSSAPSMFAPSSDHHIEQPSGFRSRQDYCDTRSLEGPPHFGSNIAMAANQHVAEESKRNRRCTFDPDDCL